MNPFVKRTLWVVAINLVVFSVLFVVLELVFGSWLHGGFIDRLSIPKNVDLHYENRLPDGTQWDSRYRRDAYGLRGPSSERENIDILTLGGSTTDQRLLSEEMTWQGVLSDAFAAAGQPKSIVNAGIDGQSSVGHIRAFDLWLRKIPRLSAKWILVYVGINDTSLDNRTDYDEMISRSRSIKQLIVEKSAVYSLFRTLRGMIKAKALKVSHGEPVQGKTWVTMPPFPPLTPSENMGLDQYEVRVKTLAKLIREFGAKPIFVTQPMAIMKWESGKTYLRDGQSPNLYFKLDRLNVRLMSVCRTFEDAICIDLANQLTLSASDYYDLFHYTPSGAKKIGLYLHAMLSKQGL